MAESMANTLLLLCIAAIIAVGLYRRQPILSDFVAGAKEGLQVTLNILPNVMAMLIAIGMFRAAKGFELLAHGLGGITQAIGLPEPLLPLALIRPFSGSAANAFFIDIAQHFGGGSSLAHLAATMVGSTETTLYIIMVYFAAAQITRIRYALFVGLMADAAGLIAAIAVVRWFHL